MNPPAPNPHPENPPQTVPGAPLARHSESDDGRSDLHPPLITAHCSLGTSSTPHLHVQSHHQHSFDDMGFVYPPEMPAEPDYDGDFDYEDDAHEHELLMHDLADDNDDFARSDDEGWYYSDAD